MLGGGGGGEIFNMYAFGVRLRYANLSNIMFGISNSLFNYCNVTITLYTYILVCFLVPLAPKQHKLCYLVPGEGGGAGLESPLAPLVSATLVHSTLIVILLQCQTISLVKERLLHLNG